MESHADKTSMSTPRDAMHEIRGWLDDHYDEIRAQDKRLKRLGAFVTCILVLLTTAMAIILYSVLRVRTDSALEQVVTVQAKVNELMNQVDAQQKLYEAISTDFQTTNENLNALQQSTRELTALQATLTDHAKDLDTGVGDLRTRVEDLKPFVLSMESQRQSIGQTNEIIKSLQVVSQCLERIALASDPTKDAELQSLLGEVRTTLGSLGTEAPPKREVGSEKPLPTK